MLPVERKLPDIELTVFNTAWGTANKKLHVSGARSEKIHTTYPFAMIRHPQEGIILYDTGFDTCLYEAAKKFPYSLILKLLPVKLAEDNNADRQLAKNGVAAEEVKTIILSHGHFDHMPGVIRFPQANVIIERLEWKRMQGIGKRHFLSGYLKPLIDGITNKVKIVNLKAQGKPYGPFRYTLDLWGDSSMILILLPGHTPGQVGLLVNLPDGRRVFFIGDVGLRENYLKLKFLPIYSHIFASIFMGSQMRVYNDTIRLIHNYNKDNPDVIIVPSFCSTAWKELTMLGLTS